MKYIVFSFIALLLAAALQSQTYTSGAMLVRASGVQLTPTITTVTANGTVTAGARSAVFVFSSDFTGSLLGVTFSGASDGRVSLEAPAGDTLAALPYTISAGNIRIISLR